MFVLNAQIVVAGILAVAVDALNSNIQPPKSENTNHLHETPDEKDESSCEAIADKPPSAKRRQRHEPIIAELENVETQMLPGISDVTVCFLHIN